MSKIIKKILNIKVWNIILAITLISDIVLHYCNTNSELNYYASITGAFAFGLYLEEWLNGKNS